MQQHILNTALYTCSIHSRAVLCTVLTLYHNKVHRFSTLDLLIYTTGGTNKVVRGGEERTVKSICGI